MKIREMIKILSMYEPDLEVQVLQRDSLDREKFKPIVSISERYEIEDGSTLEVELGTLNIHVRDE